MALSRFCVRRSIPQKCVVSGVSATYLCAKVGVVCAGFVQKAALQTVISSVRVRSATLIPHPALFSSWLWHASWQNALKSASAEDLRRGRRSWRICFSSRA